jgi:hypothetical protein
LECKEECTETDLQTLHTELYRSGFYTIYFFHIKSVRSLSPFCTKGRICVQVEKFRVHYDAGSIGKVEKPRGGRERLKGKNVSRKIGDK